MCMLSNKHTTVMIDYILKHFFNLVQYIIKLLGNTLASTCLILFQYMVLHCHWYPVHRLFILQ